MCSNWGGSNRDEKMSRPNTNMPQRRQPKRESESWPINVKLPRYTTAASLAKFIEAFLVSQNIYQKPEKRMVVPLLSAFSRVHVAALIRHPPAPHPQPGRN